MHRVKLRVLPALLAVLALAVFTAPALAGGKDGTPIAHGTLGCGTTTLDIPYRVVRGPNLYTEKIGQLDVASNLQGKTVQVGAQGINNGSTRHGTNFIVSSDGTSFTVLDVEAIANALNPPQPARGSLTLGSTVDVAVQLGPEGVFSGGGSLSLSVDCQTPQPPPGPQPTPQPAPQPPSGPCSVDVAVTKTADKPAYQPGDAATYAFDVANVINDYCTATHVVLHDALPPQFTAASVSDSRCSISGAAGSQALDCDFGAMASLFAGGQHLKFTVSGTMTTAGTVNNQACVQPADDSHQPDSDESNNCSSVSVPVNAPPQPTPQPTPTPAPQPPVTPAKPQPKLQPPVSKPARPKAHPKPHPKPRPKAHPRPKPKPPVHKAKPPVKHHKPPVHKAKPPVKHHKPPVKKPVPPHHRQGNTR